MRARSIAPVVIVTVAALALGACSSKSSSSTDGRTCAKDNGPWSWCPVKGGGYLASGEPDVNHDGKVVLAILSPGDTHDHGYYESFVDEADAFAKREGWTVRTVDQVPLADAAQDARNLCRQHVDMVAIAASNLKDAIPVASEPECKNTVWYVAGGQGVVQTKYFAQTTDIESQSGYASGVAAGLLMKAKGITKAGFLSGTEAPFTTNFAKAWTVGIKTQVPSAKVVSTYTGDFDKSDLAVEAYTAMKSQGVGLVYPYLGGATFAVATQAAKDHIPVLTPGTDNCASTNPPFAISVIFSPGDYFAGALQAFSKGTLAVGTSLTFHMGVDAAPTVKICKPAGDQAAVLAKTIRDIGNGTIDTGKVTGLDDYNGYVPQS
ncbi:MAG TPA: BMP family ABC transporter substrate-binding protein [Acidimicrobiia bacterium]|nr:BMP family ABC transporter substrate-binding protein [Acidimicrobiia bacterium]